MTFKEAQDFLNQLDNTHRNKKNHFYTLLNLINKANNKPDLKRHIEMGLSAFYAKGNDTDTYYELLIWLKFADKHFDFAEQLHSERNQLANLSDKINELYKTSRDQCGNIKQLNRLEAQTQYIPKTELANDGWTQPDSLYSYSLILKIWIFLHGHEIPAQDKLDVKKIITILDELYNVVYSYLHNSNTLISSLMDSLEKQGEIYLPSGYKGHGTIIRIHRQGKQYLHTCFDAGDETSLDQYSKSDHQVAGTCIRTILSADKKIIQSIIEKHLAKMLVEKNTDEYRKLHNDIYNHLSVTPTDAYYVNAQQRGNCSTRRIRELMRYMLSPTVFTKIYNFVRTENQQDEQTKAFSLIEAIDYQQLIFKEIDTCSVSDKILYLIKHNFTAALNQLLESDFINLNEEIINGQTPLLFAIFQNKFDCVKTLLNHGALVDYSSSSNHQAIYYAAKFGQSETVTLLLQEGADANLIIANTGNTLLHTTLEAAAIADSESLPKYKACLRALLNHGANKQHKNNQQLNVLQLAVRLGAYEVLEDMIDINPATTDISDIQSVLPNRTGSQSYQTANAFYRKAKEHFHLDHFELAKELANTATAIYSQHQNACKLIIQCLLATHQYQASAKACAIVMDQFNDDTELPQWHTEAQDNIDRENCFKAIFADDVQSLATFYQQARAKPAITELFNTAIEHQSFAVALLLMHQEEQPETVFTNNNLQAVHSAAQRGCVKTIHWYYTHCPNQKLNGVITDIVINTLLNMIRDANPAANIIAEALADKLDSPQQQALETLLTLTSHHQGEITKALRQLSDAYRDPVAVELFIKDLRANTQVVSLSQHSGLFATSSPREELDNILNASFGL